MTLVAAKPEHMSTEMKFYYDRIKELEEELERSNARMKKALEDIIKHQEFINPDCYYMLATWAIAMKGLGHEDLPR